MPDFKWSKSERRYYRDGKVVTDKTLNGWIAETVDNAKLRVRTFTQDYVDGKINDAEWRLAMRSEIKIGSRAMAQLANGGELSPKMLGSLGSAVREQNKYLDAFAAAVENGDVAKGAGMVARAEMYAEGLWSRYQNFVRLREKGAGMNMERLVLGIALHCADCPADAARGWLPIGTLVPLGSRTCLSRCRCSMDQEIRLTPGQIKKINGAPAYVDEGGNKDSAKVAVESIGLTHSNAFPAMLEAKAKKSNIPIDQIELGRPALDRERIIRAAESMANGIRTTGKGIEPILIAQKADGGFVVSGDGNHRMAALKLMGYKDDIPVLVRYQKKKVAPKSYILERWIS